MIKGFFSPQQWRLDRPLLLSIAVLSGFGLFTIYSAVCGSDLKSCLWKQSIWLALGWLAMLLVSRSNYRTWVDFSWILYVGLSGFLLYLLIAGRTVCGAKSWFSLGFARFQPSELMKVVVILVVARAFARYKGKSIDWLFLLKLMVIVGVPILLIAKQPDLGTALIFIGILLLAVFLAGLKRSVAILLMVAGLASGAGLFKYGLKEYQKKRITSFLDPQADPLGGGYQIIQSKIAIGSGGWFGKGFNKGSQSQLDFVPAKHTDFIFTVFAEEMGFVGTVLLLGVILAIILRCLRIAMFAGDSPGAVIAAGVGAIFFLHCLVNIGMVIGLVPTAGIPLPLMSYGGSSTVSMMAGFGLVLGVERGRYGS